MHPLINKKVNWFGKCLMCKKEQPLCKCGLAKDMGMDGMGTDMMMMSEKAKIKKTKKSENFIDLSNENIPGKRIKNVGGAGYTPGERKSIKIKAIGSGGEITKNEKVSPSKKNKS